MSTTLHVGKKIVQTLAASDGTTIPLGSVTVNATGAAVTAVCDPATNKVTLTGVAVATVTVNYASPGFVTASDVITVLAAPSIIVTDGPEF
jgi:hypothetical protein